MPNFPIYDPKVASKVTSMGTSILEKVVLEAKKRGYTVVRGTSIDSMGNILDEKGAKIA